MVLTSLIFCVRNYDLSQNICIRHVLQVQRKMKNHLENLLHLNPEANQLRTQYQKTYSLYKQAIISKNLVLIGALKVKLMLIQKQRMILDGKQRMILAQGWQDMRQVWSAFKKELMKFQPRWTKKDHPWPIPLAVVSRPKGDIAKSYYAPAKFFIKQRISFSWSMSLDHFLPKLFQKAFFEKKLSSYICASTIYQEGKQWIVGLIP